MPMKDYSRNKINFDKISLPRIVTLLKVIESLNITDIQKIKLKYDRSAADFNDTLIFLLKIGFLTLSRSGEVSLTNNLYGFVNVRSLQEILLLAMFQKLKSKDLKDFLSSLKQGNETYFYIPYSRD